MNDDEIKITLIIDSLEWQVQTASETDGQSSGLTTWQSDQLSWEDAKTYCESLNISQKSDWRLPSKDELSSTIDTNFDEGPFIIEEMRNSTINSGYYWSSTDNGDMVWIAIFYMGMMDQNYKVYPAQAQNVAGQPTKSYVRCARDVSN